MISSTTHRRSWGAAVASTCAVLLCFTCGCRGPDTASRKTIADDLLDRTGHSFPAKDAATTAPADFAKLTSGEPLSETDAIDLALANNAAFHEQLADLGLTRADVVQAGLIANPDAMMLIPVGAKQLEAAITAPLESFWLRGRRLESARLANDRNAERLTQVGLDLIRDVRLAYADAALAQRRLALAAEGQQLQGQVARIAQARVDAGDTGPLDASSARIDALRADQNAEAAGHTASIAEERLRAMLGAGAVRQKLLLLDMPEAHRDQFDVDRLVEAALDDRPDLHAADLAIASARQRAALARVDWINVSLIADANERGANGFEIGPGFRIVLPVFNQNQGMIARADADVVRLINQRRTLHDQVILDVRESFARYQQAQGDLKAFATRILPLVEETLKLAERAYENGQTPLVQVLDTNRQLLDARDRAAQAAADVRRAWAELERSVGRRLDADRPTTAPTTQEATP